MRSCLHTLLWLLIAANALAQGTTNTNKAPDLMVSAGSGYVLDDKHVLEPGDRVSFQILEDRDPARPLIVADSKELDAPYVGRVGVAGKTCKQVAADLKILLEKEYYYRATVIIGLDLVNKVRGKIYIWGQVRNQGAVELLFNEKLTAGKAILRAGGFSDFANKKKVKVIRTAEGGEKHDFEINMEEVLEQGKTEKDLVLEPDDYIIIPARLINF